MTQALPYNELMARRNAFVLVCMSRGKNPVEAHDFFTKKATELGWIEKVNETV